MCDHMSVAVCVCDRVSVQMTVCVTVCVCVAVWPCGRVCALGGGGGGGVKGDANGSPLARHLFRVLDVVAEAGEHIGGLVGQALVEERGLLDGNAVPVLPEAVHDAGMDDAVGGKQRAVQEVAAVGEGCPCEDLVQDAEEPRVDPVRVHGDLDVRLCAKKGHALPDLLDAARPREGVPSEDRHVVPQYVLRHPVEPPRGRHRPHDGLVGHEGLDLVEDGLVREGGRDDDDEVCARDDLAGLAADDVRGALVALALEVDRDAAVLPDALPDLLCFLRERQKHVHVGALIREHPRRDVRRVPSAGDDDVLSRRIAEGLHREVRQVFHGQASAFARGCRCGPRRKPEV